MSGYNYLETGTDFTADELQERFDSLTEGPMGLNGLKEESFALGCFRHNLLPRMIHSAELTETPISGGLFTVERNVRFTETSRSTATLRIIAEVDFGSTPFMLDMNSDSNVGAVMVLANVSVEKFEVLWNPLFDGGNAKDTPNEDVCYGKFYIEIVTLAGEEITIRRSRRSLSPRVTIAVDNTHYTGFNTSHATTNRDVFTNQDVAIRTVIKQSDLPEGDKIQSVRFIYEEGTTHGFMTTCGLIYSKANLTALPLHADVT